MFDRETVSLWIHTTGQAVVGDYKSTILEFLPSTVTTWARWKKEHPDSLVLDVRQGKGARFNLNRKPASGGISVGQPGSRLKLYPLELFQKQSIINDNLGRTPIVVVHDPETFAFHAYERGQLNFRLNADGTVEDQSGREWDLFTGTSGEDTLKALPATPWLINAWKRFYPRGQIYPDETR